MRSHGWLGHRPDIFGYDEGGQLTEAVRRKPYSVVLFDETEKAHADVFNILLQILDDGRLTDAQGRVVNFKNTVIIMTSNLGSQALLNADDEAEAAELVMEAVHEHFQPEFLNRVDELIVFKSLQPDAIRRIVEKEVRQLSVRLVDRHIVLDLSEAAKDHLATVGYNPQYGARPLKRAIQRELLDPLAVALLEGRVQDGVTVRVDVEKGELRFS